MPPEPTRMYRTARVVVMTILAGGVLFTGTVVITGCSPKQDPIKKAVESDTQAKNPWEEASKRLKKDKDVDLTACKAAIGHLKDLAGREKELQPPGLTAESEAALTAIAPLAPDDLAEVRTATYTPLDATYLADCFYLRDTARALDSPGITPSRRAELAFAWVCRQVYFDPWVLLDMGNKLAVAVPPTFVLRRGYGSGLERAYVMLALLQQMNLDGCLIGSPDSATREAATSFPPSGSMPPRGPFWAVGVRVDNDVILFDPWRGKPFPEPLSKLKANPDVLKAWFEEKDAASPLTSELVKNAAVFLSVPATALAPRMAFFEEKLKGDISVTVAVNAAALTDRVRKAVPPGTHVGFWNPPVGDKYAYVRVLAAFLPVAEGGRDLNQDGSQLFKMYNRATLPASVLQLPTFRSYVVEERLQNSALAVYVTAFFVPPTPRERIQRGQFQEAASFLSDKQGGFAKGQERIRQAQANPNQIPEWVKRVELVYENLNKARRPNFGGPELPDSHPDVAEALALVEQFWKTDSLTAQIIVDRATVQAGLTESTFLLAMCKHEEAEQAQLRAEFATGPNAVREKQRAVDAWGEAISVWRSYLEQSAAQDPFPKRVEHARALAARANDIAKKNNDRTKG